MYFSGSLVRDFRCSWPRRASPHRGKSYLGYFLACALWLIGSQAAFAAVNVSPSTLPAGTQGVLYDQTLIGSGGTGPYTFAVTAGALPAGITLDGTSGQFTGTPPVTGALRPTDRKAQARPFDSNVGCRTLLKNHSCKGKRAPSRPADPERCLLR